MNKQIKEEIAVTQYKSKYDAAVKNLIANKQVLARILKLTVIEVKEYSIEEIEMFIENPHVTSVKVLPGANSEKITGDNTESSIVGEGSLYYDIRFSLYVPKQDKTIKILINIEAQKKNNPGYKISTRGIAYLGRMISEQFTTEIIGSKYDDLKKVYSIWLCMEDKRDNAFSVYGIHKEDIIPGIKDEKEAYDKMCLVIIRLNENRHSGEKLMDFLNILLSHKLSGYEKISILSEGYGLKTESDIERGVNIMCNLSDLVEEKGIEKGIEKGLAQGRAEGMIINKRENIASAIREGLSDAMISRIFKVSTSEIDEVKAEMIKIM